MINITISGISHHFFVDTINIQERIEERSTASFVIYDDGNLYNFVEGQPVRIFSSGASASNTFQRFNFIPFGFGVFGGGYPLTEDFLYFTGVIQNSEKVIPAGTNIAKHYIECVDYHYAVDKRLAAKSYESESIDNVVTDLFDSYLEPEGLTVGQIDDDFIISQAVFNYIPVSEALDELSDRTGYTWKVDKDQKFYFIKKTALTAPRTITEADMLAGTIKVKDSNTKYRNRQVMKGVRDITTAQTEVFVGDDERTTFTVGYPIAKVPTVETSDDGSIYTVRTVGIRGIEEGKDFYWSAGENQITQDSSATPLTASQYLKVTYQGEIKLIVISQDQLETATRQAIEQNGTGIVEAVQTDLKTSSREASFQLAGKLIEKYGQLSRQIEFETLYPDLEVGQILTVDMDSYKVSDELLIQSIEMYTKAEEPRFRVTAIKGAETRSWTDYFGKLQTEAREKERETTNINEVVVVPYQFAETVLEADEPNIYRVTKPTGQTPANDLFPMFAQVDRVKAVEAYNSGGAIGRKIVAQLSGDVTAISLFAPADFAGEDITQLKWYAGIDASTTLGTGFGIASKTETVDARTAPWTKTSLETWQVEIEFTKGW